MNDKEYLLKLVESDFVENCVDNIVGDALKTSVHSAQDEVDARKIRRLMIYTGENVLYRAIEAISNKRS